MRKKIPLPWATTVEENFRERNTRVYWYTSRAWNGHSNKVAYCIGDALQDMGVVINTTPPGTPLYHLAHGLREDLIIHGTKKSKLKELPPANTNECAKTFVI